MKAVALAPVWPSGLVAMTLTAPVAALAGVVTWIEVLLTKVTLVPSVLFSITVPATPSKVTAAFVRSVPVIVTRVPPVMGPSFGVIAAMLGGGAR